MNIIGLVGSALAIISSFTPWLSNSEKVFNGINFGGKSPAIFGAVCAILAIYVCISLAKNRRMSYFLMVLGFGVLAIPLFHLIGIRSNPYQIVAEWGLYLNIVSGLVVISAGVSQWNKLRHA